MHNNTVFRRKVLQGCFREQSSLPSSRFAHFLPPFSSRHDQNLFADSITQCCFLQCCFKCRFLYEDSSTHSILGIKQKFEDLFETLKSIRQKVDKEHERQSLGDDFLELYGKVASLLEHLKPSSEKKEGKKEGKKEEKKEEKKAEKIKKNLQCVSLKILHFNELLELAKTSSSDSSTETTNAYYALYSDCTFEGLSRKPPKVFHSAHRVFVSRKHADEGRWQDGGWSCCGQQDRYGVYEADLSDPKNIIYRNCKQPQDLYVQLLEEDGTLCWKFYAPVESVDQQQVVCVARKTGCCVDGREKWECRNSSTCNIDRVWMDTSVESYILGISEGSLATLLATDMLQDDRELEVSRELNFEKETLRRRSQVEQLFQNVQTRFDQVALQHQHVNDLVQQFHIACHDAIVCMQELSSLISILPRFDTSFDLHKRQEKLRKFIEKSRLEKVRRLEVPSTSEDLTKTVLRLLKYTIKQISQVFQGGFSAEAEAAAEANSTAKDSLRDIIQLYRNAGGDESFFGVSERIGLEESSAHFRTFKCKFDAFIESIPSIESCCDFLDAARVYFDQLKKDNRILQNIRDLFFKFHDEPQKQSANETACFQKDFWGQNLSVGRGIVAKNLILCLKNDSVRTFFNFYVYRSDSLNADTIQQVKVTFDQDIERETFDESDACEFCGCACFASSKLLNAMSSLHSESDSSRLLSFCIYSIANSLNWKRLPRARLDIFQDIQFQKGTDRPTDRIEDPKKEAKPGNILRDIAQLEHELLLELSTQRILFDATVAADPLCLNDLKMNLPKIPSSANPKVHHDYGKLGIRLTLRRERFDSDAYIRICIDGPRNIIDMLQKRKSNLLWSVCCDKDDADEANEQEQDAELNWEGIEYFVGYNREWFGRLFGQVAVFSYPNFRLLFEPEYFLTKSYPFLKFSFQNILLTDLKYNFIAKIRTFMFQEISHPLTQGCFQIQQMELVHSSSVIHGIQNSIEAKYIQRKKEIDKRKKKEMDEGIENLRASKLKNESLPLVDAYGCASGCVFELERFKFLLEFNFKKVSCSLRSKLHADFCLRSHPSIWSCCSGKGCNWSARAVLLPR
jgi:hypothetical protein